MIETRYVIGVIAAMGLVTFALRALPFVGAQWLNKHPLVQRLGQFLPLAIMTLLSIHSAAGSAREHAGGPFPGRIPTAAVPVLQWRTRNALLSTLVGTAAYVAMRNFAFV